MVPLNSTDAQRYAAFKVWTPYEAALLLAGCKPVPRGHIPEPHPNSPSFNLINAVLICGPSKDLETRHRPEEWIRWYSEYLAGRDYPEFSKIIMLALEQHKDKDTSKIPDQKVQLSIEETEPKQVSPQELVPESRATKKVDRGWIYKKKALIEKHRGIWKTIERDFKDSGKNQLSIMAKAPGHGEWFEADALRWAETRGKLSTHEVNSIPETLFPTTKHRIK